MKNVNQKHGGKKFVVVAIAICAVAVVIGLACWAANRLDKIEARIDKIDDRLWVLLLGVALSILVPILLRFL